VRPCKASAHLAKGNAWGKWGLWLEEGAYVHGHALRWWRLWVGDVYVGGITAVGHCGEGGFCPDVYRRSALFRASSCLSLCKIWMQSDNPRPSYSELANWNWPPSATLDIQGGHTWTTPHVVGPHFLCTHQIWWIYLEQHKRYAPKTVFEKKPSGGILLPVSRLTPIVLTRPSYVSSCKISVKSDSRWPSYSNLTILPSGVDFGVPLCQRISELEDPSTPSWYHNLRPSSVLDKFFLDFWKSPPVGNGALWTEVVSKFGTFAPCKNRGRVGGISMDFSGVKPRPLLMAQKQQAFIRPISIHKFGCQKYK